MQSHESAEAAVLPRPEAGANPEASGLIPSSSAAEAAGLAGYAGAVKEKFANAWSAHTGEERFYRIGGDAIRLRFLGQSMQPVITPALEHLAIPPAAEAALTIDLAAGAETDVRLSLPAQSGGGGEIWRSDSRHFSLLAQPGSGVLHLLDVPGRRGFFWAGDAARLPWYEAGFPLRLLLHLWFRKRGRQLIHAAAVGADGGAVLIVGKGGSGKSTAALACAKAGLFYLGDDYILAGTKPEPRAWSLYSSAKVTTETLRRFSNWKQLIRHSGEAGEKSLLIFPRDSVRLVSDLPVRAVIWPRVVPQAASRLVPASAATLLLALAPSAILQMPGAGAAELAVLAELVRGVPAYILEAGNDLPQLAATVEKLLSQDEHGH